MARRSEQTVVAAVGILMTQELAGGTRIQLPLRVLPLPLRQFARGAMILGAMLLIAGLSPLLPFHGEGRSLRLMHFAAVLAGWFPIAFGALLLRGHSSVDCVGGTLVVREQAGPIRWRRKFAMTAIDALRVEVLPLDLGGKGASIAHESVTILAAEVQGRGRRVLLFGYPRPLLEQVVTEVKKRGGWSASPKRA